MKTAIVLVLVCLMASSAVASSEREIVASQDTPFWVNGTWVPAESLKPGDVFVTPDGKRAVVTDVESASIENASCYGLVIDSGRAEHEKAQYQAQTHSTWFTRWRRWTRALFG